jgi:hypothetical protein
VCDRVVPGEEISAVVRDVSEGGVALVVSDQRPRPGDLYRLDMRLFEGVVRQDVRVRSVRSAGHGAKVLGCAFTAISPDTAATVGDLLSRIDREASGPGLNIREALGITGDGDSPASSAQPGQVGPAGTRSGLAGWSRFGRAAAPVDGR